MAMHDALTDLPNRRLFNKQLASRFSQLGRGEKIPFFASTSIVSRMSMAPVWRQTSDPSRGAPAGPCAAI